MFIFLNLRRILTKNCDNHVRLKHLHRAAHEQVHVVRGVTFVYQELPRGTERPLSVQGDWPQAALWGLLENGKI